MSQLSPVSRFAIGWRLVPATALASAAVLLATGVGIGAYNERYYQAQKLREAEVQAETLAASVSAALAFDDRETAREYVSALRLNPEIETAGVYGLQGALVAGYSRTGEPPPDRASLAAPALRGASLVVTAPVTENGARLGLVRLGTVVDSPGRRIVRYGGIALLMVMALIVVAVLGVAQSLMRRAHRELRARANALSDANEELHVQIAEREKAEAALRHGQRMEALGRLTGGVAHDFNNILMVASSGLDLLERTSDPIRREAIRSGIRQAVERGASLTRQLLTFSRRSALKSEAIDLASQVEGMRVLLEGSMRKDIPVEIDLPPELWPVEADPSELELAILNLAVNARDAMPSGGRLRITAENLPDLHDEHFNGDYVRLAVTDTGAGIDPEQLNLVFEPFFTTKEVGKGTGLGLSQVYGFARSSRGDARIESVVGKGTTVSIYLPRSARTPAARRQETRGTAEGEGRILLVEDDAGVAAMVGEMLRELGYTVTHLASARAAVEALGRGEADYDMVFSDMVMPGGMDGIELSREVGRLYPDLPVLLTTGFSPAATAAEREGRRVLPKPYTIESLSAAIAATIAPRRQR